MMNSTILRFDPDDPWRLLDQTAQLCELGVTLAIVNVPAPHKPEHIDMIGGIAATES